MALQSSGQISLDDVRTELGIGSQNPFSIRQAELGNYVTINQDSPSKPNEISPHTLTEWYSYNHNFVSNTAPVPTNKTIQVDEYSTTFTNFEIEGEDVDGDTLTYSIISIPNYGELRTRPDTGGSTIINENNIPYFLSNNKLAYTVTDYTNPGIDGLAFGVNDGTVTTTGVITLDIFNSDWNDISTATYNNTSVDLSYQTKLIDIKIAKNGTKLFSLDENNIIYQYTLSTPYNLNSASYDFVNLDASNLSSFIDSFEISNSGNNLYVTGFNDVIYQYDLSISYNLNSASYNNKNYNLGNQDSIPDGIAFNETGTKLFIVGTQTDYIYEYNLSSSFDISTASYNNKRFFTENTDNAMAKIIFKPDGTKMFLMGYQSNNIYQYSLSTAFDITTANYDNDNKDVNIQMSNPFTFDITKNGTKVYVGDLNTSNVYEYNL